MNSFTYTHSNNNNSRNGIFILIHCVYFLLIKLTKFVKNDLLTFIINIFEKSQMSVFCRKKKVTFKVIIP